MDKKYIQLKDLEVYQLARVLSKKSWDIYDGLGWQDKKVMGDQFLRAIDSIGANIAEGYGRFHYLDKIKFYYNSRGSMLEGTIHWLELLHEREKIGDNLFNDFKVQSEKLSLKLNNFISSTYNSKNQGK